MLQESMRLTHYQDFVLDVITSKNNHPELQVNIVDFERKMTIYVMLLKAINMLFFDFAEMEKPGVVKEKR